MAKHKRPKAPKRGKTGKAPRRPRLSLVMMAKDEEQNLGRALASARDWADEIILVDTGSSDRTMEIAREYGAKVYEHPWENDFAKHRNQTLSYAQGPWCLQLDADEELDPHTAALLPKLLANRGVYAYQLEIINLNAQGGTTSFWFPRLFRKLPGVHYFRKVHNQLRIPGPVATCPVRLLHHGYAESGPVSEKRHQRRLTMIRQWAAEEPEHWEARAYLAQTLVTRPESCPEAVEEARAALELIPVGADTRGNLSSIYLPLLQALNQLNQPQDMLVYGRQWRRAARDNPDPYFFLARAHGMQKDWPGVWRAAIGFWQALDEIKSGRTRLVDVEINSAGLTHALLTIQAEAAAALGKEAEVLAIFERNFCQPAEEPRARAVVEWVAQSGLADLAGRLAQVAARLRPQWGWAAGAASQARTEPTAKPKPDSDPTGILDQARAAHQEGRWQEAEDLYRRALALEPASPPARYGLGLMALEAGLIEEAKGLFSQVLEARPKLAEAHFQMGAALLRQNRAAQAEEAFSRALGLKPGFPPAQQGLAQARELARRLAHSNGRPIRLALLTAIWKRPELTGFVLSHYAGMNIPGVQFTRLAVGSEGARSRELCLDHGWEYLERPNRPLSAKWEAGLKALASRSPDFVCILGSDDLFSASYFAAALRLCPTGGSLGVYDLWFLDLASGRMGYWNECQRTQGFGGGYVRTLGAGRIISRQMLELLDFSLWPGQQDQRLDSMAESRLVKAGKASMACYALRGLGALAMDVKSGENLWGFEAYDYARVIEPAQARGLLERHGLDGVLALEAAKPAPGPGQAAERPAAHRGPG